MCMYTTMLCSSAGLTGNRLCTMPSWMNMYMIPNSVMPSPAPKQTPPIREGVTNLNINTTYETLQKNTQQLGNIFIHTLQSTSSSAGMRCCKYFTPNFLQAG